MHLWIKYHSGFGSALASILLILSMGPVQVFLDLPPLCSATSLSPRFTGASWPRWAAPSPPIFFRIIQAPPNLTTILHIENITTKATIPVAAEVLRIKRTGAMEFPTSREIIQQTWANIPRLAVVRTQPSMASPHMVVIILSSSIISSTSQEAVISTNSVLNNSAITDCIPTHNLQSWKTCNEKMENYKFGQKKGWILLCDFYGQWTFLILSVSEAFMKSGH